MPQYLSQIRLKETFPPPWSFCGASIASNGLFWKANTRIYVCVCVCAWCVRHIKPALGSREWGLELQYTELEGQAESHRRKAPWRGWRGGRVAGRPQQAACGINLTSPCFPPL